MKIHVRKSSIPPSSLIAQALPLADYEDTYAAEFASSRHISPVDAARAFFRSFPVWVIVLLRVRNVIVALFGLKRGDGSIVEDHLGSFTGERGQSVVGFEVFDSRPGELLMGADDRHLDFRLSFFLESNGRTFSISTATTVKFNRLLGRAYFLVVKPFHRTIMPIILRRMIQNHLSDGNDA